MKRFLALILILLTLMSLSTLSFSATDNGDLDTTITAGDFTAEKTGKNQVKITGYNGNAEELTIPAELDGNKVTAIGENAFKDNLSIRFLTISEGIEEIESFAFAYSRALCSVILPQSLKTVGEGAFYYCPKMTSFAVPSTVETIGEKAFGYNYRKFDTETMSYAYSTRSNFYMYVAVDSAAYKYAKENEIKVNPEYEEIYDDIFDCWLEIPPEWVEAKEIYCYIWELGEGGIEITKWQSEESKMYVSPDSASFPEYIINRISPGTVCGVIFSTDTGEQTYPSTFIYPNGSYFYCNGTYAVSDEVTTPSLVGKWTYPKDNEAEIAEHFGLMKGYKEVTPQDYVPPVPEEDTSWFQYVPEGVSLYGDVNCDGKLNVRDATEVQKYLAFFEDQHVSFKGEILMDVYRNFNYNIKAATQIQKYCAKMKTDSMVGKPAVVKVYLTSSVVIEDEISFEYTEEYESTVYKGQVFDDPTRKNVRFLYVPVYADDVFICVGDSCKGLLSCDFRQYSTDGVYNDLMSIESVNYEEGVVYIWSKNPIN